MALIGLKDITIGFGGDPVLDTITLQLEPRQRVCLLGRNGEGKTTLMKIIGGELAADSGTILRQPALRTARLPQDIPDDLEGSVFDVVAAGLGDHGRLIAEYHHASQKTAEHDPDALRRLGDIQHRLEALGAWTWSHRVETVLSQMNLAPDASVETLSGGLKRRVLLAMALASQPDILMLDEPTNHLDIESITWLENFLKRFPGTVFFVTHDRAFMRRLATRIIELDRGKLFDWACDYDTFLKRKQQLLDDEAIQNERFDKRLSQEEAWIRQGIKARRTRNEGRVKRLQEMRFERTQRRETTGQVQMTVHEADSSGRLVVEAVDVGFSYADTPVVKSMSTTIMRGDRVGVIGPNGCGKTTLLRLLLGELKPTEGHIRLGTRLEIVYFDQLREELAPHSTVFDCINHGNDKVEINGHWRSVYSYLQDFLFTPERVRSPVSQLSGGELNRLMLARLFTRPANLLILDEPTNDLDIETLELLEEKLLEFSGTLLLVSHDRDFIDNLVTSTLVFEADGVVNEYAGGYSDWLEQRSNRRASTSAEPNSPPAAKPSSSRDTRRSEPESRKLKYKEKKELDALPTQIEALEAEQQTLYARLGDPALYQNSAEDVGQLKQNLEALEAELETAYVRWADLEERQS